MNNFDVTILTSQGDSRIKLIPTVSNVVLETSQSCPGFYKNIDIELSNESLEQLRTWLDCYFKEREEDKKNQKLISNRMDAYELYIEALADSKTVNSEIPKNTIEYFSNLKNYFDFSIPAPQLYASHRHTVLMKFLKASDETTHKLTLEFLMIGNSVNTILYKIEIYNETTGVHFLMKIKSEKAEKGIINNAYSKGIKLSPLSQYYKNNDENKNIYVMNYSSLDSEKIELIVEKLKQCI